jgi:hypothetical protein
MPAKELCEFGIDKGELSDWGALELGVHDIVVLQRLRGKMSGENTLVRASQHDRLHTLVKTKVGCTHKAKSIHTGQEILAY